MHFEEKSYWGDISYVKEIMLYSPFNMADYVGPELPYAIMLWRRLRVCFYLARAVNVYSFAGNGGADFRF